MNQQPTDGRQRTYARYLGVVACEFAGTDNYRCSRPATEPDGRCLMHSPDPQKDRRAFRRCIDEQVARGNFDFHGFVFLDDLNFRRHFFAGRVDFGEAAFLANVNFYEARFQRKADFSNATFARRPVFGRCQFPEGVTFYGVAFPDRTEFHKVGLGERSDFILADLGHVIFRSLDLSHCRFRHARNIHLAEFHEVTWAMWPDILKPAPHIGRTAWVKRLAQRCAQGWTRPAVADETDAWKGEGQFPNEVDVDISGEQPDFLHHAERVYRGLRASYESRNDHPRASGFYVSEMEVRRLSSTHQSVASLTALYGLFSGYGERWVRALVWFIVLWLIWTMLYLNVGIWVKDVGVTPDGVSQSRLAYVSLTPAQVLTATPAEALIRIRDAALHSFFVSTLIGRDIYAVPATWLGQIVQAIQVVLGPLFLALMGLAIRRRFKR